MLTKIDSSFIFFPATAAVESPESQTELEVEVSLSLSGILSLPTSRVMCMVVHVWSSLRLHSLSLTEILSSLRVQCARLRKSCLSISPSKKRGAVSPARTALADSTYVLLIAYVCDQARTRARVRPIKVPAPTHPRARLDTEARIPSTHAHVLTAAHTPSCGFAHASARRPLQIHARIRFECMYSCFVCSKMRLYS